MITDQFNHAISYVKCHNSPTSFRSVPQNITSPFGVDFLRNGTEPDVKSIYLRDRLYHWAAGSVTLPMNNHVTYRSHLHNGSDFHFTSNDHGELNTGVYG